jgi:hypothetical protein
VPGGTQIAALIGLVLTLVAVALALAGGPPAALAVIAGGMVIAWLVVLALMVRSGRRGGPAGPPPEAPPAEAGAGAAPVTDAGRPPEVPPPATGDQLDNRPWLALVEECVALFDELDRHAAAFDPPRREVAEHVTCRLREILERCGVEPVDGDTTFDRNRHQPDGGAAPPAAPIAEVLSPGFAVGRRVLRRARVRLGDAPATEKGPMP